MGNLKICKHCRSIIRMRLLIHKDLQYIFSVFSYITEENIMHINYNITRKEPPYIGKKSFFVLSPFIKDHEI